MLPGSEGQEGRRLVPLAKNCKSETILSVEPLASGTGNKMTLPVSPVNGKPGVGTTSSSRTVVRELRPLVPKVLLG